MKFFMNLFAGALAFLMSDVHAYQDGPVFPRTLSVDQFRLLGGDQEGRELTLYGVLGRYSNTAYFVASNKDILNINIVLQYELTVRINFSGSSITVLEAAFPELCLGEYVYVDGVFRGDGPNTPLMMRDVLLVMPANPNIETCYRDE